MPEQLQEISQENRHGPERIQALPSEFPESQFSDTLPKLEADTELDGRYIVEEKIGKGKTSDVYAAHDTYLDTPAAIKLMKIPNREAYERLLVEEEITRVMSGITQDSIQHLGSGVAEYDGRMIPYIALQRMAGESMAKVLDSAPNGGKLAVEQVVAIVAPPLRAAALVHDANLSHKDLKPENFLVDESGDGHLSDYGYAGISSPKRSVSNEYGLSPDILEGSQPRKNRVLGTLGYIPPEVITGGNPGKKADVFAAGAVIYQALTGERVMKSSSSGRVSRADLIQFTLEFKPPKKEDFDSGVSDDVVELTINALDRNRKNRPKMYEMAERLVQAA